MSTLERTPHPKYALAARELLRETLFDAARSELEHRAWSEVTMADVAAAAGVSRQTLYKEFGSRDEFAQAFVLREADGFISEVERRAGWHLDDPQAALTAAFGLFLIRGRGRPVDTRRPIEGPPRACCPSPPRAKPWCARDGAAEHRDHRSAGRR